MNTPSSSSSYLPSGILPSPVYRTMFYGFLLVAYVIAGSYIEYEFKNDTNDCGNLWYYNAAGIMWIGLWAFSILLHLYQQRAQPMFQQSQTCAEHLNRIWNSLLVLILLFWGAYEYKNLPNEDVCPRNSQWKLFAVTFWFALIKLIYFIAFHVREFYLKRSGAAVSTPASPNTEMSTPPSSTV